MSLLQQKDHVFNPPPQKILYCFSQWQSKFDLMQNTITGIEFFEGLPSSSFINEWSNAATPTLIVLDDLIEKVCSSEAMLHLFTVQVHHLSISTIVLSQSLYPLGKYGRVYSLNCTYIVLFRNLRDGLQIRRFGGQLFPYNPKYFMQAYEHATSIPFGNLIIDIHPHSDRKYQLRSCILYDDIPIIYVPKV
jgi:hypothetical protein